MFRSLATTAFVASLLLVPALAAPSLAEAPRPGEQPLDWCLLEGGEMIPQPAGSSIRACCADDGCFICDVNWGDCTFDPANGPSAAGGRSSAPGGSTMAQPPQNSGNAAPAAGMVVQPMMRTR